MGMATITIPGTASLLRPLPSATTTKRSPWHVSPRMSVKRPQQEAPQRQGLTLLKSMTRLVWGESLPPQLLISTARHLWSSTWLLMMSQLAPSSSSGSYSRPPSPFRLNPSTNNPNPSSLHLYVGLPCPWAHRTLIVRALKGLQHALPVSIASPGLDGAWLFTSEFSPSSSSSSSSSVVVPTRDTANGCRSLREVYGFTNGGSYDGRVTVPMLWDVHTKRVVCNESYDIILLLNSGFNDSASNPGLDLAPPHLNSRIHEWNRLIYPSVNNGVYRCGFAQSQEAYDTAVKELFSTLDTLEGHLATSRYLCGDQLTLADVCLFTTLIRFDLVYNGLFKCTKKKLLEYPNLHAYMRDIYQIPKVAETCNFEEIMDGYYKILFPLNPGSIQPVIPSGCESEFLSRPHNRESLSSSSVDENREVYT